MDPKIYFDYAAATPLDDDVQSAMLPYLEEQFYNPSSIYQPAKRVREAVEDARHRVAQVLGAKPTEIIFTSGGTESINAAISGVLYKLSHDYPDAHWVTSAIEHDAVLAQRAPLERAGFSCATVEVKANGLADAAAVTATVNDQTVLVSLQLANNEIGTIQPVAEVAQKIAKIRADRAIRGNDRPLYLHTDAVQAANFLDLSVSRLGIDLLSLSGSKIYGPKGSGILYVRTGIQIQSLLWGGGQERGHRSGTENVAGVVGFAAALEKTAAVRKPEALRLTQLRDQLWRQLQNIPDVILNGDPKKRLPNNLNLIIPGLEGQALVMYLDQAGILASTGSACSSGDLDPSHVLLALGRSREQAAASLRLTLGRSTTEADIAKAAELLHPIVERLRSLK
jgi:cysteine desulfurase